MRRLRPRRRQGPIEVKDWVFLWPEDSQEPCDHEVNRQTVPRLGNNWIKAKDGCLTVQVDPNVETVSVNLKNVNYERVKRIEVNDGHRIMFTAKYDGGALSVEDGGYGPSKN